jgi:serine/threonine protein kinase
MSRPEATSDVSCEASPRLLAAVADFLQRQERAGTVDRQALLAEYADVADELAEYFSDHDRMNELAAPLRSAGENVPDGGSTLPSLDPTIGLDPSSAGSAAAYRPLRIGPYEVEAELGRGGMGVVYKARHGELKRTVALKTLLTGRLASPADRSRFAAEATSAAKLEHSGIVPIFDVGEADGQPYFAMPLIAGPSLADRLREKGRLAPQTAARMLRKIVAAVAYAHGRGVVHRDLKPANILLAESDSSGDAAADLTSVGEPKITDFGLAKRLGDEAHLTASGQILGTPSYMPPEQAAGRLSEVGPAADIYALGAILYAMLTGRPPFQAESPVEVILQVLEREPLLPSKLVRGVPRELEWICLKCLEKRPADRYASADSLLADLDRYLRREPPLARRPTLVQRLRRWVRRQPVLAGHVVGLSVPLAVSQIVFTLHPQREWPYHLSISGVLLFWIAASLCFQWLMDRKRTSDWPLYLWSTADAALLAALLYCVQSPLGAFFGSYLMLIAAAGLAGSTRLVGWMTACCGVSYLTLLAIHPTETQPPHYIALAVVNIVLVGLVVGYQVWRMSVLREYYGDRN